MKIFTQYEVMHEGRTFQKNQGASEWESQESRRRYEVPKRTFQLVIYRDGDVARGSTHCYLDWET